ncbi:MAG: hypothetical protein HYY20_01780 [Candidatus Tectomicrobia bacterium]|uniref:Uncharacterized protein n=1 Tax=Tectimicrobiota bacterium TaxID=2528274 RepID=A0A932FVT3_UNCTE|nr:hypothetical protein [Candidatus Tectomicrobia bacterium]
MLKNSISIDFYELFSSGRIAMSRRDKKVTCVSCGEKVDPELVTRTKEGYLCEGCYDLLGDELDDEEEGYYEDEELDFSEEEEEDFPEDFEDDEEDVDDYENEEY